jgi:hypothetical protein
VSLLGYNQKLKYSAKGGDIEIEVPWLSGDKLPVYTPTHSK